MKNPNRYRAEGQGVIDTHLPLPKEKHEDWCESPEIVEGECISCETIQDTRVVAITIESNTLAKRIANALNIYKTKKERKHVARHHHRRAQSARA